MRNKAINLKYKSSCHILENAIYRQDNKRIN